MASVHMQHWKAQRDAVEAMLRNSKLLPDEVASLKVCLDDLKGKLAGKVNMQRRTSTWGDEVSDLLDRIGHRLEKLDG